MRRVLIVDRDPSHYQRAAIVAKRLYGDIHHVETTYTQEWGSFEAVMLGEGSYSLVKEFPPVSKPRQAVLVYERVALGYRLEAMVKEILEGVNISRVPEYSGLGGLS